MIGRFRAWLDHRMGLSEEGFGSLDEPQVSTTVLLEKRKDGTGFTPGIGGRIDAFCGAGGDSGNEAEPCYPLPGTVWTDYFLHPDGTLAAATPDDPAASQAFFAVGNESWQLLRRGRVHDDSGFDKDCETALARVPSLSPAPSGRCGLPP